jgi:hypothetical protein
MEMNNKKKDLKRLRFENGDTILNVESYFLNNIESKLKIYISICVYLLC